MRLLEEFSNEQAKTLINQAISCESDYSHNLSSYSFLKVSNKNFENWAKNKEKLFELLGNKLIIEKEVEYEIVDEVKQTKEMDILLKTSPFIKAIKEKLQNYCQSTVEIDIIKHLTHCSTCLKQNIVQLGIFCTNNKTAVFEVSETQKVKIQNGMKIMRLFHKLAKAFNISEELFNDFTIKHSQILASKKQKDTLCLSIHPFDFATMSDNENKWKSCMSWRDSGCYRHGTVEMMQSPYIIEAYIPSKTETFEFEDGTPWNSKKWRELIIVSDDLILPIKGYPFECPSLEQTIMTWLHDLANIPLVPGLYNWRNGATYLAENEKHYVITHIFYSLMYNDLGSFGSNKKPCLFNPDAKNIDITLNKEDQCMCCGEVDPDFQESYVLCDDCEIEYCGVEKYYCSCCDCELYDTDIVDPDGYPICESCRDERTYYCIHCDAYHWIDTGEHDIKVCTKWGGAIFELVCDDCFRDYMKEGKIKIDEDGEEYIDLCT